MAVAEASMKHGLFVRLSYRPTVIYYTEIPEGPLPYEEREEIARRLVHQFNNHSGNSKLFSTLRYLRRGNKRFEEREVALSFISNATLEAARRDALVEMLGLGLDADPLFTKVASASLRTMWL